MPHLHIKTNAIQMVSQSIYESSFSVTELAENLALDITHIYAILTGVKPLTFEVLMELSFYLDLSLADLTETKHLAIEATVKFFDKAIKFDRQKTYLLDKNEINERLNSLIGFIEYEFGKMTG